jgi:hypothetical protein
MILQAVGFGRGFPRSWMLPIVTVILLLGAAVTGWLSRSIVADLIAWWPVWLGLALAAYLLRERKVGLLRVAGLVPLVAFAFVLLFAWGHLAGWAIMPSASQRLVGPTPEGVFEASMVARVDGEITVGAGDGTSLYRVEPIKHGGVVGIPAATEEGSGGSLAITLEAPDDAGIYGYAGWEIQLADTPVWDLQLDGAVDADLASLQLSGLSLDGAGTVTLGSPTGETPVVVLGDFRVRVPADAPVRVVGVASVPASWTLTDFGAVSPGLGEGWVLTVVGDGSVAVSDD